MTRIKCLLDRLLMSILVFQGIALVLIIGISVFFRYVMGAALSWPEEVALIVFVWYTLLGIVVLVSSDSHIAFDFISSLAGGRAGRAAAWAIRIFSQVLVILYGLLMAVHGWKYMMMFPDECSPAADINLTWLKISVPVTGVILIFFVCFNLVSASKSKNARKGETI